MPFLWHTPNGKASDYATFVAYPHGNAKNYATFVALQLATPSISLGCIAIAEDLLSTCKFVSLMSVTDQKPN
jgi:hypothetical protein